MNENLIKALDTANFTLSDLQNALFKADPVSAIVLIQLITDSASLVSRIDALRNALSQYTKD